VWGGDQGGVIAGIRAGIIRGFVLKLFWDKKLVLFFQLISIIQFEPEPACMLKVGFVEDEGRVFDLRQFEHQLIILIEESDRIVSPAGFGE
jgi:hypothetical protein